MTTTGAQASEDLDYTGNVSDSRIGWHKSNVNQQLLKNLPKLTDGGANKKIFVPLCGKSVDLVYLYSQGHRVFGVEAVPQAIEELNVEHSLDMTFNPDSSTYTTKDSRITIYCGDIFSCPFEKFGPFDCVWDRASFYALEYSFRPAYKEMMQRCLHVKECDEHGQYHPFKYLLEALEYNREKFPGPPRAVDAKDMDEYFGDWTNIEVIHREPLLEGPITSKPDIGEIFSVYYFLTPK